MTMKWFDRLFPQMNPPFEALSNACIHAIVSPYVESLLLPKGFAPAGDLKWVRDRCAPIRHLFMFEKLKGGIIIPHWGVSLDFVPHVTSNEVRWHRSAKAARQDLGIYPDDPQLQIPYTRGEAPLRRQHQMVVATAVVRADDFWRRCETEEDLPAVVDDLKATLSDKALSFYNFTQHPLAAAFIYARAGAQDPALAELAQYGLPSSRPDVVEKLRKLIVSETSNSLGKGI